MAVSRARRAAIDTVPGARIYTRFATQRPLPIYTRLLYNNTVYIAVLDDPSRHIHTTVVV